MVNAPAPKINAMLLCDKVITEAGTNKKSLIGIFENINASVFPCTHQLLSVYIKLTDANGSYKFSLELVDLENDKAIGRGEIPQVLEIKDPLVTRDLVFNLAALKFSHPGKYEFRIFANDRVFGQKTFLVNKTERTPKPDPGEHI